MKIRLVEDIVDDVKQRANETQKLLNEVNDILVTNEFTRKQEINGTSYFISKDDINASFYISDDLNYKGYITTDSSDSINFNLKGTKTNLVSAVNKFIKEWDELNESREK